MHIEHLVVTLHCKGVGVMMKVIDEVMQVVCGLKILIMVLIRWCC